ncbi:unnamed protein product [Effrenium voratum]|uniref:Uncharacterized protein n=1 Tax=Effrenium voratum TaxID=2562239 RepID=A0AA36IV42_9DINO|nr:unnamed protein product [Effrenium voratum]
MAISSSEVWWWLGARRWPEAAAPHHFSVRRATTGPGACLVFFDTAQARDAAVQWLRAAGYDARVMSGRAPVAAPPPGAPPAAPAEPGALPATWPAGDCQRCRLLEAALHQSRKRVLDVFTDLAEFGVLPTPGGASAGELEAARQRQRLARAAAGTAAPSALAPATPAPAKAAKALAAAPAKAAEAPAKAPGCGTSQGSRGSQGASCGASRGTSQGASRGTSQGTSRGTNSASAGASPSPSPSPSSPSSFGTSCSTSPGPGASLGHSASPGRSLGASLAGQGFCRRADRSAEGRLCWGADREADRAAAEVLARNPQGFAEAAVAAGAVFRSLQPGPGLPAAGSGPARQWSEEEWAAWRARHTWGGHACAAFARAAIARAGSDPEI